MSRDFLRSIGALSILLVMAMGTTTLTPPESRDRRGTTHSEVNAAFGLGASSLLHLDVPPSSQPVMQVELLLEGELHTLALARHTNRAIEYVLRRQLDDGSFVNVIPGPVGTYRGRVRGIEGSSVTASRSDDGLHASIEMGDGRRFLIEPLRGELRVDGVSDHVLFVPEDVAPLDGACGMPEPDVDEARLHLGLLDQSSTPSRDAIAAGGTCIVELACDADVEFFNAYGSVAAVEARINAIVNDMNVIYEGQVGISYQITTILVRTGSINSDPYSSNHPSGLQCDFITEWSTNQTQINRDLAVLYTGKNIQFGVLGAAADFGDICNPDGSCTCHPLQVLGTDGSYAWVADVPTLACATFLSAHEIGHLWGAIHCDCLGFIMNAGGNLCPTIFTDLSKLVIETFRDSRQCLDGACADNPLTNDLCIDATDVAETQLEFSTFAVGTECPALPAACDEGGGLDFLWDLWYRYTASCSGDATISLCGSFFDTRLIVYDDQGCPPLDGDLVACDDDFCGVGSGSQVTVQVTAGQTLLLRVGGFNQSGSGTLTITCDGPVPCPSDVEGDGTVGITDFLATLAQWGDVCPCTADINGDGMVGIIDFLQVLSDWGPCT